MVTFLIKRNILKFILKNVHGLFDLTTYYDVTSHRLISGVFTRDLGIEEKSVTQTYNEKLPTPYPRISHKTRTLWVESNMTYLLLGPSPGPTRGLSGDPRGFSTERNKICPIYNAFKLKITPRHHFLKRHQM